MKVLAILVITSAVVGLATAGKHKRGLSEELHHVDLEHAHLQHQYDHSAHIQHEAHLQHQYDHSAHIQHEAAVAPTQQLEAPYPAQYAALYQAPYAYGAAQQVAYANPEWIPAAPPAQHVQHVQHVQTIIKKVPVPVPIERPIPVDNPISIPVERLVPVENPVPIVKHVPQPIPQPYPVEVVKHVPHPIPVHVERPIQRVLLSKPYGGYNKFRSNGRSNLNAQTILAILRSAGLGW